MTFLNHMVPALLLVLIQGANGQGGPIKLYWTTDHEWQSPKYSYGAPPAIYPLELGTFGPDGPWQGLSVPLGHRDVDTYLDSIDTFPFWPSPWSSVSEILTVPGGGKLSQWPDAPLDYTRSDPFYNSTNTGTVTQDAMSFFDKDWDRFYHADHVPVVAISSWNVSRSVNGAFYAPRVGTLGLAHSTMENGSLLQQLNGETGLTNSFGLHINTARFNGPGSFILGGYDQRRVLGKVGVFDLMDEDMGFLPRVFLSDVTLGVQVGLSPFNDTTMGLERNFSIFQGTQNDQADQLTQRHRGQAGSAMVVPDPTVPLIYLPPGTCEKAASYLPVTWDSFFEYYVWDVSSPRYARIVNSPAYMGFVLTDRQGNNVTIKMPFRVLDLSLSSPIDDPPVAYFPCKSVDSTTGYWKLGRAFLQAAFLGVNYNNNLTFLAQAPGPWLSNQWGVNEIHEIHPDDVNLLSHDISEFENSWSRDWTITTEAADGPSGNDKQKKAVIGGSIVGGVVGVFLIGFCLYVCSRLAHKEIAAAKLSLAESEARRLGREVNVPVASGGRRRAIGGEVVAHGALGGRPKTPVAVLDDVPPPYGEALKEGASMPPPYGPPAGESSGSR
ncbi:aspartic peptidase domain-containing protein [Cercophora scortea]|uniref:Aspartic peptidase domain-containing protein n=1 Tax=Cercophora scortea TaxID=314031 RepID=A0AAE0I7W4_9PEZI|nr:aspartic peptidase domain-containing protein [Cercophora scortea]